MSLRRRQPTDSLDMLLDTMCNTFGGIILIAVLVALLTKQEREARSGDQGVSNRGLSQSEAEANLAMAAQLGSALREKVGDNRWKAQLELLTARESLRREIASLQTNAVALRRDLESAQATDPAARLSFLTNELAMAREAKKTFEQELRSAEAERKRIDDSLAEARNKTAAILRESERSVRLPKEFDTLKRSMFVIAKHGRLYLCHFADQSKNAHDLRWKEGLLEDSADPIPGRGIDLNNPTDFVRFLSVQSSERVYLVFCVFEDSFAAYVKGRQIAAARGFDSGWKPYRNSDGPVTWSQGGNNPKPQ